MAFKEGKEDRKVGPIVAAVAILIAVAALTAPSVTGPRPNQPTREAVGKLLEPYFKFLDPISDKDNLTEQESNEESEEEIERQIELERREEKERQRQIEKENKEKNSRENRLKMREQKQVYARIISDHDYLLTNRKRVRAGPGGDSEEREEVEEEDAEEPPQRRKNPALREFQRLVSTEEQSEAHGRNLRL